MHPEALELFRGAGQRVEDNTVFLDPDFVLEQVAKAPREFDVQARNPARGIHLGGDHMNFAGVYGPPFVREGAERRDATLRDFERFCQLAQSFDELDSAGGTIVEPERRAARLAPPRHGVPAAHAHRQAVHGQRGLGRARPRHARACATSRSAAREAIEQTPVVISLVNCNSPLRWDDRMIESAAGVPPRQPARRHHAVPAHGRDVARLHPGDARPADRGGARGHLAGADHAPGLPGDPRLVPVQHRHAVRLAAVRHPGVGHRPLCTGQIARRFGLPWRSGGGLTSSQTADAQAAYEAMMTMLPTFLAGTNWVMHSAGWLESGLVSSYEKFVIDVEILRMLQVEFTPLEIREEDLALDAHTEVGHGGHFLGCAHTMERFRTCFYRPLLSRARTTSTAGRATAARTRPTARWRSRTSAWRPTRRRRWTTPSGPSSRSS